VLTAMAKSAFGGGASTYGLFNVVLAAGSVIGALLAGSGVRPTTRKIMFAAAGFGLFQATAALAPDMTVFLALLCGMGLANLVLQASANSYIQLAVDPELRGRVMGLYMLSFIGGTPIGAPVIGLLTSHYGARAGMAVCGAVPVLAVAVLAVAFVPHLRARVRADVEEPRRTQSRWHPLSHLLPAPSHVSRGSARGQLSRNSYTDITVMVV
jgi:MFS family permease